MITYKLAKQLKETGFPQAEQGHFFTKDRVEIIAYEEHDKDKLSLSYIPTLSELIDACGDDFHWLNKMKDAYEAWFWSAMTLSKKMGQGDTPEEAVANLWLKLTEKE